MKGFMNSLKKHTVRTELIVGFAICILTNALLSAYGFNTIDRTQEAEGARFTYYGQTASMIAMSYAEINDIRTNARNVVYMYEDNAEMQEQCIAKIEGLITASKKDLNDFVTNTKEEDKDTLAAYEDLMEAYEAYLAVLNNVLANVKDGNFEAAQAIMEEQEVAAAATMEGIVYEILTLVGTLGVQNSANIKEEINILRLNQLIIGCIGTLCAIVMAVILIRYFRKSISDIVTVSRAVAAGDVNIDVEVDGGKNEFCEVMREMDVMVHTIKEQAQVARQLSEGDLTAVVTPKSEKDVLGNALKKLVDENNVMMHSIRESSMQVTTGSEQVASASQSLAQGTTEQASAIEEVSSSIVEIAEKTKVNANDANEANRLVMETKEDAVRGNEQMQEMIHAMDEINESSENISKIIKVIDDIAFQTNILALNAAVEAARAGAHGKGFAVVAEEVRNLAGKSASAASETAEMIEDSIRKVENGAKLAQETAVALKNIVDAVDNIVNLVNGIATASNEQATAIAQIDQAISQVAQVVQTDSATSEQCAAASEELANQAEKLRELISGYRLKEMKYNSYFGDSFDRGSFGRTPQISLDDDVYRLEDSRANTISLTAGGFGKY